MVTLETQYENYLLENPRKKITFEEWKDNILFSEAELDLLKKKIELEREEREKQRFRPGIGELESGFIPNGK